MKKPNIFQRIESLGSAISILNPAVCIFDGTHCAVLWLEIDVPRSIASSKKIFEQIYINLLKSLLLKDIFLWNIYY